MMLIKIWERFVLKEIFKIFLLILCSFYFLFIIMDSSTHMEEIIKNKNVPYSSLFFYYILLFSKLSPLLFPLALLISTVKVLCSLNKNNELVAMQAGGISLKKITMPFLFVSLILTAINYLNIEYSIPYSLTYTRQFEKKYFAKQTKRPPKKKSVFVYQMDDGTRLIYQNYNSPEKSLFDVFWVLSSDEIWHMKTLTLEKPYPKGQFVDHIKRNSEGELEKKESYETYCFNTLSLDPNGKTSVGNPIENRSISDLYHLLQTKTTFSISNKAAIKTHLYYKLFIPWMSFLVVIGAVPFCIHSRRYLKVFLIFSLTIFGYLAFYMILDSSIILGENRVISPFLAIYPFPILFFIFFGRKFLKIC